MPCIRRTVNCFGVLIALLVLTACGVAQLGATGKSQDPSPPASPIVSHPRGEVSNLVGLVDALRAKGLTVEPAGPVSQPFFDVEGTRLQVDGTEVQVFEFADAAAAQATIAQLGPDGNPPTMIIDWVGPPHFYQAGRIVVLYVGEEAQVIQALTEIVGRQVAGR